MNKWIILEKELIFGTQPRCILFLHVRKPTGYKNYWNLVKKTGRREEVVLASKIADLTLTYLYAREE
jgi:hypothetical protein